MQAVRTIQGASCTPLAGQLAVSTPVQQVASPNSLTPKISFFGSVVARVRDQFGCTSVSSRSNGVKTGIMSPVRAAASSTKTAPVADDKNLVYKGIAKISKKRVSLGNLVKADLIDGQASLEDKAAELLGKKIEIQLVSVNLEDGKTTPKLSPTSTVEGWVTNLGDLDLVADVDSYSISFKVPKDFGEIGAIIVRNNHPNELFMESVTLQAADKSTVTFATSAWIYNHSAYTKDRVFFTNKVYLPANTPPGLNALRQQELQQLRGDGTGERKASDRVYDYDVYNDLGTPGGNLARSVLGGSKVLPYPRRLRTGRPKTKQDPKTETRLASVLPELPYIPSDEYFRRTKNSTFIAAAVKGVAQSVFPAIETALTQNADFRSNKQIMDLYVKGLEVEMKESIESSSLTPEADAKEGSLVIFNTLFSEKGDSSSVLNYPLPQVISVDQNAWKDDAEFGRQCLAGTNPGVVALLTVYPPKSSLDPAEYGEGTALTNEHILPYLEGKTVAQAIKERSLFTVDYHDAFLPFINLINADKARGYKCYATRTILFHNKAGQLKPVAIELSLPPAQKGGPATNRVFTPADAADHLWDLAKIHATAIDANYHEVLSHFTFCHAAMEPFVIAANRQLSELHPIKSLMRPFFKDTLSINSAARALLINADGVVEDTFSAGKYSFELAAKAYGALWRFDTQGLPQGLLARGMAEPADSSYPGSVKLVLEDYPYAKDGLEMWDAIHSWVAKYVELTYKGSDDAVKADTELQAFWSDIVNVGHGDLKDATWWPKLDSTKNLVEVISTIAWIAGPTHASVNFGQYSYYGFPLNKPSGTRAFIPEKNSTEYKALQTNPEKFLLSTITSSAQATKVMTVVELLATHSVDEEYIGTRLNADWTSDPEVKAAFREFSNKIATIADNITKRNKDPALVNRRGPAQVPYTLLFPTSTTGLTGQGVPNSVSI